MNKESQRDDNLGGDIYSVENLIAFGISTQNLLSCPIPFLPSENLIAGHILNRLLVNTFKHAGIYESGALAGEFNLCAGIFAVTDVGRGLELLSGEIEALKLQPPLCGILFYDSAELIWRDYRGCFSSGFDALLQAISKSPCRARLEFLHQYLQRIQVPGL